MIHRGKTAIITGAASGIGEGIARRLTADGAHVVIADRDAEGAARVADELGGRAVPLDVTDEAAMDALFDSETQVDIAVLNAGIIQIAPVAETAYEDWRRLMAINVDGVFLGARAAARVMLRQGSGVIVTASSGAGRKGVPNLAGYCASKAAILMLTQSLALELAPHGIRVNAYTPGHIETPFWEDIAAGFGKVIGKDPEDVIEIFRASVPMGRFGRPEDVAAAVSWLASDEAGYVTGQAIGMNGGELPW